MVKNLGKWPRLLVKGDPVDPLEAQDILLRTTNFNALFCNDREWSNIIREIFGLPSNENLSLENFREFDVAMQRVQERFRALDLHYLCNHRIASAWIGGPHGWCDWDGTIGCSTYNIGKWPREEEVKEEWDQIAAAFPYLKLTSQLVSEEGAGVVAVEWRIENGKAETRPPGPQLPMDEQSLEHAIQHRFTQQHAERGISEEDLRNVVSRFSSHTQL